ncbi:unnamed protein product [Prorocentrum cordatum]|uniref:Uncharacterized protein n=1 Tax=Prorocentrum cordatum TaxID=2364126 RepID=A0ABN9WP02_9DINO|nr:unnamed protein product [Polarella glacialis]
MEVEGVENEADAEDSSDSFDDEWADRAPVVRSAALPSIAAAPSRETPAGGAAGVAAAAPGAVATATAGPRSGLMGASSAGHSEAPAVAEAEGRAELVAALRLASPRPPIQAPDGGDLPIQVLRDLFGRPARARARAARSDWVRRAALLCGAPRARVLAK